MANQLADALPVYGFKPGLGFTRLAVHTPRTFRQVEGLLIVGDENRRSWWVEKSALSLQAILRIAQVFNTYDVRPVDQPLHVITGLRSAAA